MTEDDVRRVVASLPGTEERPSYGTPGFRVRNRLFARITDDGSLVVWVPDEIEKQAMLETEPTKFRSTPHYDGHPMVLVRLEEVDERELLELLTDSWELRGGTAGGRWTCPRCSRQFGRANQGHDCRPGVDVDAVFAGRPPEQRAAYDAVLAHLRTLGEVHEDAVGVGVFLKRTRKLAELRPKQRWLTLTLRSGQDWEAFRLTGPQDIDGPLRDRLHDAFNRAG